MTTDSACWRGTIEESPSDNGRGAENNNDIATLVRYVISSHDSQIGMADAAEGTGVFSAALRFGSHVRGFDEKAGYRGSSAAGRRASCAGGGAGRCRNDTGRTPCGGFRAGDRRNGDARRAGDCAGSSVDVGRHRSGTAPPTGTGSCRSARERAGRYHQRRGDDTARDLDPGNVERASADTGGWAPDHRFRCQHGACRFRSGLGAYHCNRPDRSRARAAFCTLWVGGAGRRR